MSVIDCLNTLLFDTNAFNTVIVTFCLLVTAVVWISSGLFIRKLCISQDTITVRESNPIYFWSIICCTILLCLIPPTIVIDHVLWIHYYHPYPHINYDTNACKNINLLTLIQAISIPFTLVSAPSYCCLICVYFQRLIIIFQNTAFQVSDKVKRYFIFYIVVSFISYIIITVFEIVGIDTAGDRWSFLSIAQAIVIVIYLLAYIIESFYICYLLRRQLFSILRLMEKMASNANNAYSNNQRDYNHDRKYRSQSYASTGIAVELKNTDINTNFKTSRVQSLSPSITSITVKTDSHESNINYAHHKDHNHQLQSDHYSDRDRNYNSDDHSDVNHDHDHHHHHGGTYTSTNTGNNNQLQRAERLDIDAADVPGNDSNINNINNIGSPDPGSLTNQSSPVLVGNRTRGTSEEISARDIGGGDGGDGVRSGQGKVCYNYHSTSRGSLKDTNELFKKLKRLTILTYSTLISTLISVIMIMLVNFIIDNIRTGNMVLVVFIVFDVSINFACLSLQFSFADNIYNVLCRRCEKYQTFSKVEDVLTVTIVNNDNTKNKSYRT